MGDMPLLGSKGKSSQTSTQTMTPPAFAPGTWPGLTNWARDYLTPFTPYTILSDETAPRGFSERFRDPGFFNLTNPFADLDLSDFPDLMSMRGLTTGDSPAYAGIDRMAGLFPSIEQQMQAAFNTMRASTDQALRDTQEENILTGMGFSPAALRGGLERRLPDIISRTLTPVAQTALGEFGTGRRFTLQSIMELLRSLGGADVGLAMARAGGEQRKQELSLQELQQERMLKSGLIPLITQLLSGGQTTGVQQGATSTTPGLFNSLMQAAAVISLFTPAAPAGAAASAGSGAGWAAQAAPFLV